MKDNSLPDPSAVNLKEEKGEVEEVHSEKEKINKQSADNASGDLVFVKQCELDGRLMQKLYLGPDPELASTSATSELSSGSSRQVLPRLDSVTGLEESEYQHLDRYGFIQVTPGESNSDKLAHYERSNEKEVTRSVKWQIMLDTALDAETDISNWPKAHRKFEKRLAKGIPDSARSRVWPKLASRLVLSPYDYKNLYLKISGYERQIDLDIERTLRDHMMFKIRFCQAQVSLFKILVAYSNFDPIVGYCQGMSTVAAFLLLYFNEEVLILNNFL